MIPAALLTLLAADPAAWIPRAGGTMAQDAQGRVTSVDLRSGWVTDADLPELAKLPALSRLDLSMTRISDQGLQRLTPLKSVAELNLYYAEFITDEGMSAVKAWKNLRRVNLRGTKITDTTLAYLGALPAVESVDAGFAQITDNGIELLSTLPKLRELTIGGNKLTDVGLQAVRLMPGLVYLDLSGSQRTDSGLWQVSVTDLGLSAIASVKNLRELRMGGTSVTARGVETLRASLALEQLSLERAKRITDEVVPILIGWKSLKRVDLHGTGVTAKAVAELRQARPDCEVLF